MTEEQKAQPPMSNAPNDDRARLIKMIARGLDTDTVAVERFDAGGDTVIVAVWPDDTRQDTPNRFAISVKHLMS